MEFTDCLAKADVVLSYIYIERSTGEELEYRKSGIAGAKRLKSETSEGVHWGRDTIQCEGLYTFDEV